MTTDPLFYPLHQRWPRLLWLPKTKIIAYKKPEIEKHPNFGIKSDGLKWWVRNLNVQANSFQVSVEQTETFICCQGVFCSTAATFWKMWEVIYWEKKPRHINSWEKTCNNYPQENCSVKLQIKKKLGFLNQFTTKIYSRLTLNYPAFWDTVPKYFLVRSK